MGATLSIRPIDAVEMRRIKRRMRFYNQRIKVAQSGAGKGRGREGGGGEGLLVPRQMLNHK